MNSVNEQLLGLVNVGNITITNSVRPMCVGKFSVRLSLQLACLSVIFVQTYKKS